VLEQLFREDGSGFFVDVGAFAPFWGSNTYLLYRRGWHGLNIEANPDAARYLRMARPRDVTLSLAVSTHNGRVDLALRGPISGIIDETYLWDEAEAESTLNVECRRLENILDDYLPREQVIDLLDVDCEGHDLHVLQSNNWERYRPRVVLAEWHHGSDVPNYLTGLGYQLYCRLHLTGVFIDPGQMTP
jgi:FkbM family methyltransferase